MITVFQLKRLPSTGTKNKVNFFVISIKLSYLTKIYIIIKPSLSLPISHVSGGMKYNAKVILSECFSVQFQFNPSVRSVNVR